MTSNTPARAPSEHDAAAVTRWAAALACALAGLVLFQFWGNPNRGYIDTASLFYWWGFQWINPNSETQHGWLILGLSGWLCWRNLGRESGTEIRESRVDSLESRAKPVLPPALSSQLSALDSSSAAFAALLAGLLLHALGFAAQQARVSILAFLLFTWGVLRLGGGRRWGAATAFPIAFMVFAIPVSALDTIGFWLRLWVVNASAGIAHAVGIGVLQSGTQLVGPDGRYNYDVAYACSGIRSLTALTALSLLAGYLNFQSPWRRVAVLALCFPLVYVGNVARIVAIVFAAQLGGPAWGDVAHTVMGYGVFVIVLAGVLGGVAALRRFRPEQALAPSPAEGKCHLIDDTSPGRARWVAGAVVGLAVGEMLFLQHLTALPPRGSAGVILAADGRNPVELPAFLGTEWIGQRADVTPIEREVLPEDTGFSRRNYVNVANPRQAVYVSIVLSGKDRTSIHRPEICLLGQGWTIAEKVRHVFQFPGRTDAAFAATLLRVRREVQAPAAGRRAGGRIVVPEVVAYWFVSGDGIVASHWQRMWRDAWNRVVHGRADRWSYVLLQTTALDGEPAALARMQTVLDATLPGFQRPFGAEKP